MVYLSHVPAGTSTMNVAHWAQMTRIKTVQKYDFGAAGNLKAYGQVSTAKLWLSYVEELRVNKWGVRPRKRASPYVKLINNEPKDWPLMLVFLF